MGRFILQRVLTFIPILLIMSLFLVHSQEVSNADDKA